MQNGLFREDVEVFYRVIQYDACHRYAPQGIGHIYSRVGERTGLVHILLFLATKVQKSHDTPKFWDILHRNVMSGQSESEANACRDGVVTDHKSCVLSFTEDFREFLINVITTNITGNDFPVGGKDDGVWKGKDAVCFCILIPSVQQLGIGDVALLDNMAFADVDGVHDFSTMDEHIHEVCLSGYGGIANESFQTVVDS